MILCVFNFRATNFFSASSWAFFAFKTSFVGGISLVNGARVD